MSHTHKRFRLSKLNPVRWYRRRHRGEASPLWVMTATAPFEVPILAYFSIIGWWTLLTILVGQLRLTPGSVIATLPLWLIYMWAACFAFGSTVALIGRYLQRFPVESSGLALLGAAFFTYAVVVTYVNGLNAIFASGAYVALLSGCLVRMRVISFDQKARQVAVEILHEERNGNGDAPR
jgi:hypothetical protein